MKNLSLPTHTSWGRWGKATLALRVSDLRLQTRILPEVSLMPGFHIFVLFVSDFLVYNGPPRKALESAT